MSAGAASSPAATSATPASAPAGPQPTSSDHAAAAPSAAAAASSSASSSSSADVAGKEPRPARRCRFFNTKKGCRRGASCQFRHDPLPPTTGSSKAASTPQPPPPTSTATLDASAPAFVPSTSRPATTRPPSRKPARGAASAKDEIAQLAKRYPDHFRCSPTSPTSGGALTAHLRLTPSDPDWPGYLDIVSIALAVHLPAAYPTETARIETEDPQLPAPIANYINHMTAEYAHRTHRPPSAPLSARGILRWLDKNLEPLFLEAAKLHKRKLEAAAAGLEFVSPAEAAANVSAAAAAAAAASDEDSGDDHEHEASSAAAASASLPSSLSSSTSTSNTAAAAAAAPEPAPYKLSRDLPSAAELLDARPDSPPLHQPTRTAASDSEISPDQIGIEVRLRNLRLEGIALVRTPLLALVINCERCKYRQEAVLAASKEMVPHACGKCSSPMVMRFRRAIAHEQSAVIGYLDIEGATPVDGNLARLVFDVECTSCLQHSTVKDLQPGVLRKSPCRECHTPLGLGATGLQFLRLGISGAARAALAKIEARAAGRGRARAEELGLRAGTPLPDNGTCSHYKKSYRWLRFPCCGRAFPCDLCHDKAAGGEHPTERASRMICGWCSVEQPFAQGGCRTCDRSLTSRSSGKQFWEGGKGCRNTKALSKNDPKKHANSKLKTHSKKEQRVGVAGKLKTQAKQEARHV